MLRKPITISAPRRLYKRYDAVPRYVERMLGRTLYEYEAEPLVALIRTMPEEENG